ncbi:hypothetical protein CLPUN_24820 [Clostridium puniceum]|uniref:Uncharacterized protein n=1 Tax=Clostridium puniceum TaxID=29367 RepID=A0A1S8TH88_9CLOT|nr:hypothetical protein [Clostridium puniceum]OOM77167.1 hypothetical protein CLPUN_24820 [Clostridium puniceum]
MNCAKINKEIIMLICIMVISFINSTYVYGLSDLEFTEFAPINMEKTANGAIVEVNSNETYGYELDVNMSTKGLNEGYYTAYLYEDKSSDWSNYEAMSFHVSNNSDNPIRINMNIKKGEDKVFSPSNDNIILIQKNNSEIIEKVKPSYGTVELPERFEGIIYIPFNSFREENGSFLDGTNKISSWGIIATLAENEERNFKLSRFNLINKGSKLETYFDSNSFIKGKSIVQIPIVGESISDYKIEGSNRNIQFKLDNDIDGITISENGRLTVTPDVVPQKIEISAVLDNSISEKIQIQLVTSWTLSAQEVDGTSKSIAKPDQIKEIINSNEKNILTNNVLINTRIVIVFISIIFGGLYWSWNRKNKDKLL